MSKHRSSEFLIGNSDGPLNLKVDKRSFIVCCLLAVVILVVAVFALRLGSIPLSFGEVSSAFFGNASKRISMVVLDWRLPRILTAIVIGAALAMSGAVFQSLVRNPLGSPDIIGFNTGAYTGVLLAIGLFQGGQFSIIVGALTGGMLTAFAIYLLAWKQGILGFRLIVIGIAVNAMLSAFNTWFALTSSLEVAMSAAIWGAGSLNGVNWQRATPTIALCIIAMLTCLVLVRKVRLLELGDDTAGALGLPVKATRLWLMAFAVLIIAATTAAVGPITFVALAAPQIAQRLCRKQSAVLLPAALTGALLLLLADIIAQHLFSPISLPVGIVTLSLGGFYMLWLLLRSQ